MTNSADTVGQEGANLSAYEGVEAPENFQDQAARERYCAAALERSSAQAAFIGRHVGHGLDVLEIGCGNGRLGIALSQSGVARRYVGLDVAQSRINFARDWAGRLRLPGLEFEQANALEWEPRREFDAVLCITGAFGYFDAMGEGTALRALTRFADACKPSGKLILELYNHLALERRCLDAPDYRVRDWSRLPDEDPFQFYLHEFQWEPAARLLKHRKLFIPRDARRALDERTEALRLYRSEDLMALLTSAGFDVSAQFAGWTGTEAAGELTIVAALPRALRPST